MKKVKHWLHILLTLLTGGLWLPVYVIVIATTEMFNRGYREGKAAGRREIAADPEWMRVSEYKGSGAYVVPMPKGVTTFERFKELGDRMLSGDPLDSYEQLEYQQLRKEVVR